MKKFIILTIAMISLFMYSEKSRAGLLLEPYAGIHFNSKVGIKSTNDSESVSGSAVGGRLGFQNLGLMLGLDAKMGTYKISNQSTNDELKYKEYGFFIGYDFPILLRVWGEYIFSGTGELNDSKGEYSKISGTKLGIGYKIIPFVSLNLEIGNTTYKDYEFDAGGKSTNQVDFNTYLLSLSIPITL